MAIIAVSIMCIALIVVGGMALSQGILTSADSTALSVDSMSAREGELMRTEVTTLRAANQSWSEFLRVIVDNNGQTKLGSFDKWDVIVHYYDEGGSSYSKWLPYTDGVLGDNEWQQAAICLNGQPEIFEPGLLNPGEEMIILAKVNPPPADATAANITIATPNGICKSIPFANLSYTLLTPHSENTTIAGTEYFQLAEGASADGAAMIETTDAFEKNEVARKLLYDENHPSRFPPESR